MELKNLTDLEMKWAIKEKLQFIKDLKINS
jgi:hypothetical protein